METFYLNNGFGVAFRSGDVPEPLRIKIKDRMTNAPPANISDVESVKFVLKREDYSLQTDSVQVLSGDASYDVDEGILEYIWTSEVTGTLSKGSYFGYFRITWGESAEFSRSFPVDQDIPVNIK